jgi:hypothetical protein
VQTFLDNSLCIAEDTPRGRHLVFPSQYRREKDIPHDPDIFVSYTFSGEWQTVWTTLVVRLWYSQEFEHRELWRNAAEFASHKGHALGLKMDHKQAEGEATIGLYFDARVPDELKVIFIEYVHRHLASYACDVLRDRRYVCPECGKPVKDRDEVRERLAAGKTFIYCQKCDQKAPLIDFIEQRLKSDPVDVCLVISQESEIRGEPTIRWMNVTRYLRNRNDQTSRQINFAGEKLDMEALWKVRDEFFPPRPSKLPKRMDGQGTSPPPPQG